MAFNNLPGLGGGLGTKYSITQEATALGAGGLFANSNNICTITYGAAHGLTQSPAAGVPPNFFITFSGVATETGVGTLNGNYFRILAIPSATTIQIYSTVTAADMTGATGAPVFFSRFGSTDASGNAGTGPNPDLVGNPFLGVLGANCEYFWNTDDSMILLDAITTPSTGTPATAPAIDAVTAGGPLFLGLGPAMGIQCLAAAGTTVVQALN